MRPPKRYLRCAGLVGVGGTRSVANSSRDAPGEGAWMPLPASRRRGRRRTSPLATPPDPEGNFPGPRRFPRWSLLPPASVAAPAARASACRSTGRKPNPAWAAASPRNSSNRPVPFMSAWPARPRIPSDAPPWWETSDRTCRARSTTAARRPAGNSGTIPNAATGPGRGTVCRPWTATATPSNLPGGWGKRSSTGADPARPIPSLPHRSAKKTGPHRPHVQPGFERACGHWSRTKRPHPAAAPNQGRTSLGEAGIPPARIRPALPLPFPSCVSGSARSSPH